MRRTTLVIPAALAGLALTFAACGANGNMSIISSPPTTDMALTLTLQHSPAGPILATGAGNTLYDFVPDTPTHSACIRPPCSLQWPPLLALGPVRVGRGVNRALVGTLTRPGGSTQLSYGGHPLYLYASDTTPGTVMGQAINQDGGVWYVLDARGKQITTAFTVLGGNLNGNGNGNLNGGGSGNG